MRWSGSVGYPYAIIGRPVRGAKEEIWMDKLPLEAPMQSFKKIAKIATSLLCSYYPSPREIGENLPYNVLGEWLFRAVEGGRKSKNAVQAK
jgi:hypothetical protein